MRVAHRGRRPWSIVTLTVVLLLEGVMGLVGGFLLLSDPRGAPMGMPVEMLDGSPFGNYLVPGLLLRFVLGVYPMLAALLLWRRPSWRAMRRLEEATGHHWTWSVVLTAGLAMIVWIAVQVVVLEPKHPMQALIAAMGAAVVAITFTPAMRHEYVRVPEVKLERRSG